MRATDIPGFDQLSGSEKMLLVEQIWDSIAVDESKVPVPDSHLSELNRRLRRHHANPGKLLTLEGLVQRVQNRK